MTRREHFVRFMSPGTMFDETSERPIASWNTHEAMAMADRIVERHGSKPYGFSFATKVVADSIPDGEGGTLKVEPKTVATSGTYFINGKLRTYDDVVAAGRPDESILRSNMRGNSWWITCETTNGWKHVGIFEERDRVVGMTGEILESGDDPRHVGYRKHCEEWCK